jgi:hypothetical protein
MSLLRNILSDLREKKLWPVAVLLLVALAAIPVVLGGGGDDNGAAQSAAVPATPASPATPDAKDAVVALEQPAAGKVERAGKTRDPFVQHHQPKAQTTTTAAASNAIATTKSVVSGSGGASADTTSAPSSFGSSPSPSSPSSSTTTTKPVKTTWRVDLSFGESDATKSYKNVARLTPLPSADDPFFVFLGVSDDGKSATFMVNADADPSGDGKCLPSASDCQTISLGADETEFFDLQSGTAGVVQYELDLHKIRKVKVSSTAAAAKANARESAAGRDVLRNLLAEDPSALGSWKYEPSTGLLMAVKSAAKPKK